MRDEKYQDAIKQAKHYLALGMKEVWLSGDNIDDKPWHLTTKCEPGGSHRLEISTSVWFYGKDPKTGLEFRWSFDIEPREANGTSTYQIDAMACAKVLNRLPASAAKSFRKYLSDCAKAVRTKADEWQGYYLRQLNDANTLDGLAAQRESESSK